MRVRSLLAAAATLAIGASTASADFIVNVTREAGTGNNVGFDVVRYYAKLPDGSPEVIAGATGLQSAKVSLTSPSDFKIGFRDIDNLPDPDEDGVGPPNDANIYGDNFTDAIARTRTSDALGFGTHIRLRDPDNNPFSVQGLGLAKTQMTGAPFQAPPPPDAPSAEFNRSGDTGDPVTAFANTKSIRVEGFLQNAATPGVDTRARSDALGALFAVAVVPTGAPVRAYGSFSPDAGSVSNFDTDVPEPATLGFIGLATVALAGRRRRA